MSRSSLEHTAEKETQTWLLESLRQRHTAYPCLPLNPELRQIRLLHLDSSKGKLRGSLTVVTLSTNHEEHEPPLVGNGKASQQGSQLQGPVETLQFEALSYTWGESLYDKYIEVQDHVRIPITDNLARALRRLRHRAEPKDLWIDAICINQSDLEERSQQVAYMGEIYNRAYRVIIWLGDLPDRLPLLSQALFATTLKLPDIIKSRHLHAVALYRNRRRFQQALEATLRDVRPRWHERVWTVQEYVLSRRNVYYHGPFRWATLGDLELQFNSDAGMNDTPYLKAFFNSFHALQRLQLLSNEKIDLHQATVWISKRECTDPRDKIYGLLSLLPARVSANLIPDYTQPIEQVAMDATYAALLASNNMNIFTLAMVSDVPRTLLPTWAIDFANLGERDNAPQFGLAMDNGSLWYARFKDNREGPRFSRNGRDLKVIGSRFDVIEEVVDVPVSEDHWELDQSVQRATEMLDHLVQRVKGTSIGPTTAYGKSIWGTLHHDGSANIVIDLDPISGESDWRRYRDPLAFLEKVASVGNTLCKVTYQPIKSEMKSYQRYLDSVSDHASVVASAGGLLAIASGIVKNGDIIAMVAGAHGPVMLRPDKDSGAFAFRGFVLLASYGHHLSLQRFWTCNGINVENFTLH